MDPVTAFGIATNVAALVELSWKIVSKSREIYNNNSLPENRDTEVVTADLQKINDKILGFLHSAKKLDDLNEDDVALRELCESSNRIATELVKRLGTIKIGDDHRAWKSVRQALKSVWIKSELDETAARLQVYRTQLNTRILVSLRGRVESLVESNRNIASSISESRVLFTTNQDIQTDFLTRFIASQHEKTRELLASGLTVTDATSPLYPSSPGRTSPSPARLDPKEDIFEAVGEGSIVKVRRILREDPSTIFAFNSTGQTLLHVAVGRADIDMVTYLIRNGARINSDDDEGRVPLHRAVEIGSEPIVRSLIAKGADVHAKDMKGRSPHDLCDPLSLISWIFVHGHALEAKDEDGCTALWHFAKQGDLEAVRILLDQDADTGAICWGHRTPLFPACDGGYVDIVELLLARGADVSKRDDRQSTALVSTGWHGHTSIGELLLDYGADINAVNQHEFSALHECCDHARVDMALMLLRRGAKFEATNQFGYAPIHQAAMQGHTDLVHEILGRGGDINLLNPRAHWTALSEACEHGHLPVVELLLTRGADTEEWTGEDRKTALVIAAEHGYTSIVKAILDCGRTKLNAADKDGKTALYCAVAEGHAETTQVLVDYGADVNYRRTDGWSPLAEAAWRGRGEISRILIKSGANPNSRDNKKYAPLNRAAQLGHLEVIIILLDEGKADIEDENEDNWTALAEACWHPHEPSVKALLQRGANPNSRDNQRRDTPLHRAAQTGYLEVAVILLDEGQAEIDAENGDGWTPLLDACWHGHPLLVQELLRRGARTDIPNKDGDTGLSLAKVKRHSQVIAILEENTMGGK